MTMQSDVSVETAAAEDLWWDDADAEDNRLRKLGAKACSRLLALLQQHQYRPIRQQCRCSIVCRGP